MTPRKLINFFRSPTGALLGFLLVFGLAMLVLSTGLKGCKGADPAALAGGKNAEEPPPRPARTTQSLIPLELPKTPAPPAPTPTPPGGPAADTAAEKKVEIPPISLYVSTEKEEPPLSEDYAPFGRLLQCKLVVTVDSSAIETPIIGLVTEDLWHGKRLIVPAGTEIHGKATVDRTRERIASDGRWTLVWQDGLELSFAGLALDRQRLPDGKGYGITDGSAGLRGDIIKTDNAAEIKLFAASFLSATAQGVQDTRQTLLGNQVQATAKNAALSGVSGVLNQYAERVLDGIARDGFFTRVPAGTQFYVYVTQTLDVAKAHLGANTYQQEQRESAKAAYELKLRGLDSARTLRATAPPSAERGFRAEPSLP